MSDKGLAVVGGGAVMVAWTRSVTLEVEKRGLKGTDQVESTGLDDIIFEE